MEVTLRPISKLWQDTWDLYREHIGYLLLLTLIPQAIVVVLALLFGGGLLETAAYTHSALLSSWLGIVFIGVLALLIAIVELFGSLSLVIYIMNHEKSLRLRQTYRLTLQYFWRYVGLMVLISLISGGVTFAFLVVLALVSGVTGAVANLVERDIFSTVFLVGMVLTSLPGAIFGLFATFGSYFLVGRNIGPWTALIASLRSVHRNFWEVFFRLMLIIAPIFAIGIVLSLIPVGQLIYAMFIPPLLAVYYFDLYRDLQKHP